MKTSRCLAFGVGVVALSLVLGCQTAPKGPTDEELIAGVVSGWQEALTAKDMDALMALYSENYVGQQGEDKAGVRTFLEQAAAMGYLDGMEVDASGAETVIEEGTATVGPVVLSGAMGSMNMKLEFAKEEDGWLIVSGEQQ
jgi:ketosteroid isomerase-like protein